ncbi:MAG: hypothetical protein LQ340_001978 [Diploschistes diacapsis]|nr:MAG: hypothetical protein LQ340_001978 [Diploschistes diacapsis]
MSVSAIRSISQTPSPLIKAARSNNSATVQSWTSKTTSAGRPYTMRQSNGYLHFFYLLSKRLKDMDLKATDNGGNTPFHTACVEGQVGAICCFLRHGVRHAPKNYEGKTDLQWAEAGWVGDLVAFETMRQGKEGGRTMWQLAVESGRVEARQMWRWRL